MLKPIAQTRNVQENSFERIISEEQTERRETRQDLNYSNSVQHLRSERYNRLQIDSLEEFKTLGLNN
jgi:hypothetical protein